MKILIKTIALVFLSVGLCCAGTITDGFEGSSLSSLWTPLGIGTATLTSAAAHSGSQSVLQSVNPDFPWFIDLEHDFASDQTGTVSVYSMDGTLGSAASLELGSDLAETDFAVFQRNSDGSFQLRVRADGTEVDHTISEPLDSLWHQLQITVDATGTSFAFDGSTVYSDSRLTSFQFAFLSVWGASVGSNYFDDFSATTTSAAPEPASWELMGFGLCAAVLGIRRLTARG